MAVKVLKRSNESKMMRESFDFNEFQRNARKIRMMISDLTMDLDDAIDSDIYDKQHGVEGPRELSPGIADKICDELQEISGICNDTVKILINEYNL